MIRFCIRIVRGCDKMRYFKISLFVNIRSNPVQHSKHLQYNKCEGETSHFLNFGKVEHFLQGISVKLVKSLKVRTKFLFILPDLLQKNRPDFSKVQMDLLIFLSAASPHIFQMCKMALVKVILISATSDTILTMWRIRLIDGNGNTR